VDDARTAVENKPEFVDDENSSRKGLETPCVEGI
jgi:hypothetical protein